jgi:hypothetical protein
MFVVGIDPGPVVGVAVVCTNPRFAPTVIQVNAGSVETVLEGWHTVYAVGALATERFVVGPRAARSSTPAGGARARAVVELLSGWAAEKGVPHFRRSASEVKPWATDGRLAAAGLLELTKGMRHARDAARHALFCAVKDYGLPDPLSAGTRDR